jgi:hypothetical protein
MVGATTNNRDNMINMTIAINKRNSTIGAAIALGFMNFRNVFRRMRSAISLSLGSSVAYMRARFFDVFFPPSLRVISSFLPPSGRSVFLFWISVAPRILRVCSVAIFGTLEAILSMSVIIQSTALHAYSAACEPFRQVSSAARLFRGIMFKPQGLGFTSFHAIKLTQPSEYFK